MTNALELPVASPGEEPLLVAPRARPRWRETADRLMGRQTRALLLLALFAAGVRLSLCLVSSRPIFTTDSGAYLTVAHDFDILPDRAVGVSVFYRAVFALWHDLRAVVVAQAVLGAASAVLTAVAARLAGLRPVAAHTCGVMMALSPSMLVYERMVMAETLTIFLTVSSVALVLWTLRRGTYAGAIVAGVAAGLSGTVRTNGALLAVGLVMALLLARVPTRLPTRLGLSVSVLFGAMLPLAGYGALTYVDSRADYLDGVFALTVTDGFALFSRVASLTDCSDPAKAPAMRAEVCAAGDDYLNSGDAIVWGPGPVNAAFGSLDVVSKNRELRALARENIRAHPWTFLGRGVSGAWTQLTTRDFVYAARASDYQYTGDVVERYFGKDDRSSGHPRFADVLQRTYGWWISLRTVLWGGLAGAMVMACRRNAEPNVITGLGFGLFVIPLGVVGLAATPLARYAMPYEFVAAIGSVWLIDAGLRRLGWPRTSSQRGADED